jgi:hypothetical protein
MELLIDIVELMDQAKDMMDAAMGLNVMGDEGVALCCAVFFFECMRRDADQ